MDLKERYTKEVVPALMTKFGYKSIMQVPKLEKIVINMGVSDVKDNSKALENAIKNKKGKVFNKYMYQDIDENGEYIEGGQL